MKIIKDHPITTFIALAVIFGTAVQVWRMQLDPGLGPVFIEWLQMLKTSHYFGNLPMTLTFLPKYPSLIMTTFLYPAAPTIAALIIVGYTQGRKGYGELFKRLLPWQAGFNPRKAMGVYIVIALGILALSAFALMSIVEVTSQEQLANMVERLGPGALLASLTLILACFIDVGAFFEELGWRGYLLPKLLGVLRTPLGAAIILGIIWGLWHMPRDIPLWLDSDAFALRYPSMLDWLVTWFSFCLGTTCITILCVLAFNLTGGSILPAFAIHGASNTVNLSLIYLSGGLGYEVIQGFDPRDIFFLIAALVVIALYGPQLGASGKSTAP